MTLSSTNRAHQKPLLDYEDSHESAANPNLFWDLHRTVLSHHLLNSNSFSWKKSAQSVVWNRMQNDEC